MIVETKHREGVLTHEGFYITSGIDARYQLGRIYFRLNLMAIEHTRLR